MLNDIMTYRWIKSDIHSTGRKNRLLRPKQQSTASKPDTILNKKLSTIRLRKPEDDDDDDDDLENNDRFFHHPNRRHEPPVLFFPFLLRKYEKQKLLSFLPLLPLLVSIMSVWLGERRKEWSWGETCISNGVCNR